MKEEIKTGLTWGLWILLISVGFYLFVSFVSWNLFPLCLEFGEMDGSFAWGYVRLTIALSIIMSIVIYLFELNWSKD